ncbi:MAG: hypothetical protein U0S48_06880 [Solirubrobacteraceae bacterium]
MRRPPILAAAGATVVLGDLDDDAAAGMAEEIGVAAQAIVPRRFAST